MAETLNDLIKKADELSFAGYTIDMLKTMAKEFIELLEIEFYDAFKANDWEPSCETEYIRGKMDIIKVIFDLKKNKVM